MFVLILRRWVFLSLMLGASIAHAQSSSGAGTDETGANVTYEGGFHLGNLLPNQIPGLTEITGMGGLRGGYRTGDLIFLEGGVIRGRGHGAELTNAHASIRMDVPIENIVGLVFIGPNMTYYKGSGQKAQFYGGGHVGGGVQALIGGNVWFRSDMTFFINPGTSLYFSFGLTYRYPGGGGS